MGKPPAPPGQSAPPGHGGTPPGHGGTPPGHGGTPPGHGGTPPGQGKPPEPEVPPEPPVDAAPEHPIVIPPEQPPVDAQPEHPIIIPEPPVEPPEEIIPPDPPEAGTLRATVTLDGQDYLYDEADGVDVGTYTESRFAERCTRVILDDCPLRFDFRRMEGRLSVVCGQGAWQDAAHVNLPAYSVTISGDELAEPVVVQIPSHGTYQRWRWQSGPWPLPMRRMEDLYAAGLLPRFDYDLTRGTEGYPGPCTYTPMGLAGFTGYMPQTGGRVDIGHVTQSQGWYMGHEDDPAALADVLAQAEAAGTFTWDFFDNETGAVIDPITQYPQATVYSAQAGSPFITFSQQGNWVDITLTGPPDTVLSANGSPPAWNMVIDANNIECRVPVDTRIGADGTVTVTCEVYGGAPVNPARINPPVDGVSADILTDAFIPGTGIYLDTAHMPACSYLPFLLTGDPYHLENLQRQVAFCIMESPSSIVRGYGVIQPRGTGWSARTLAACAKVSPESPPSWLLPRSLFHRALQSWAYDYVYAETVMNPAPIRADQQLAGYMSGGEDGTNSWYQPWQEDICAGGWAWIALLHPDLHQWNEIAQWKVKNLSARLDPNSGWSCAYPSSYVAKAAATGDADVYTNWADAWAGNAPFLGDPRPAEYSPDYPPPHGDLDYPLYLSCALAIAWQVGIPEAEPALTKLETSILAGLEAGGASRPGKQAIAGPVA
jgi:hypothetical protein